MEGSALYLVADECFVSQEEGEDTAIKVLLHRIFFERVDCIARVTEVRAVPILEEELDSRPRGQAVFAVSLTGASAWYSESG